MPKKGMAQTEFKTSEYELMALFIQNFTNYITWPVDSKNEKFNIIVYKHADMIVPLQKIAKSKKFKNKTVQIDEVRDISDIKKCNILIVGNIKKADLKLIVDNPAYEGMLIVSSREGLANTGAHINFIVKNNQIRFEVNKKKINEREMIISSQLLKLAILVD